MVFANCMLACILDSVATITTLHWKETTTNEYHDSSSRILRIEKKDVVWTSADGYAQAYISNNSEVDIFCD